MKIIPILLGSLCLMLSQAYADFQPIDPATTAYNVAGIANNVFAVTRLKLGNLQYKIVSLDSELNGDLAVTTIVLVGENGVGGAAGFDAAFLLSPEGPRSNFQSARIVGQAIELSFTDFDNNLNKVLVHYDPQSRTLVEN